MQSHKAQGAAQIPSENQGKHFKMRLLFYAWSKHSKQTLCVLGNHGVVIKTMYSSEEEEVRERPHRVLPCR